MEQLLASSHTNVKQINKINNPFINIKWARLHREVFYNGVDVKNVLKLNLCFIGPLSVTKPFNPSSFIYNRAKYL